MLLHYHYLTCYLDARALDVSNDACQHLHKHTHARTHTHTLTTTVQGQLSSHFNIALGEKLTEHLKHWMEPEKHIFTQPPQAVSTWTLGVAPLWGGPLGRHHCGVDPWGGPLGWSLGVAPLWGGPSGWSLGVAPHIVFPTFLGKRLCARQRLVVHFRVMAHFVAFLVQY